MYRSVGSGAGFAAVALCTLLAACTGANVEMEGDIPTPLVNRLPLKIGLYFEPALVQYVFEEKIQDHGDWRINVGPMQPKLFRKIASALFDRSVQVDSITPTGMDLDAVLAPTISEFQISIPSQTRSDFYEVWIKYTMKLYDIHGTLIAQWPLTAYGKSNKADFGFMENSDQLAIRQATLTALRDAAAFLSLRFATVPEVKAWMNSRGSTAASGGTT